MTICYFASNFSRKFLPNATRLAGWKGWLLQSEQQAPRYRGRHVWLLAKIPCDDFLYEMLVVLVCAHACTAPVAWGEISHERIMAFPFSIYVKVFCLCSLPWILTRNIVFFKKFSLHLSHILILSRTFSHFPSEDNPIFPANYQFYYHITVWISDGCLAR
jgi:hypothetical protein